MRTADGARLASRSAFALLVVLPLILSCIVIQPNDSERINRPPVLISPPTARGAGRAVEQIIKYDKDLGQLTLPYIVRDPDGDALFGRVYYDYIPGALPLLAPENVFENLRPDTQPKNVEIPRDKFMAGTCHRVELLVSSGFRASLEGLSGDGGMPAAFELTREPVVPDDVARMIWWVQVVESNSSPASTNACPL